MLRKFHEKDSENKRTVSKCGKYFEREMNRKYEAITGSKLGEQ